jgi:hypothetical protein
MQFHLPKLSVVLNLKKDNKNFFSYMKSKTKSKDTIRALRALDGSLAEKDVDKCSVFNDFFTSVFTKDEDDIDTGEESDQVGAEHLTDVYFDPSIVLDRLSKLKLSSAPGPDDMWPKLLHTTKNFIAYPLALIFNKSVQGGDIPQDFKDAQVCPIYKKGSKELPGNYRPVSLTSIVGKLMEGVIKDQIVNHLDTNNTLSPTQHGFRKRRSCTTNLVEYLNKVTKLLDGGEPVDIVFFDFSKAFYLVPHKRLLHKMSKVGIKGNLLHWIEVWLSKRRQRVVLNGSSSEWADVLSGVPQGSVLGPLLFLIYINDLGEDVKSALSIFADDTKLFAGVGDSQKSQELQDSIDKLHAWASKWLMKFNTAKCSVMHLGVNNPHNTYTLDESILKSSEAERDIGVIVQEDAKFGDQCSKSAAKCYRIIGQIRRSFQQRDPKLMMSIFNTYVRPHIEYAVQVWNPCLQKYKDILESVQRRFTRMIDGMDGLSYEERLTVLEIPSLEDRRRQLDLIQAYKFHYGIDSIDHRLFTPVQESHNQFTRNASKMNFVIQPARLNIRKHFFTNRVTSEWNNLPETVQRAPSLAIFKSRLNSHMY